MIARSDREEMTTTTTLLRSRIEALEKETQEAQQIRSQLQEVQQSEVRLLHPFVCRRI